MLKVLITGNSGLIGFHLAQLLLKEGYTVHGFDGMTDYYNVNLKKKRHDVLKQKVYRTWGRPDFSLYKFPHYLY